MTNEGQGLGRSNGLAVFVKGAVPGDEVIAELTKVKKKYAFAKIDEFVKFSEKRIEPYCEYAETCGGCALSHLDYDAQTELKGKQVYDRLVRLGGLEEPLVRPVISMDEPYRYRNKASMPIWAGGLITKKGGVQENLGEVSIGFYEPKSHNVVDCYDCLIQSEPAMAAAEALRQFMKDDNITVYDPKWEKGLMKHLIVKTAYGTGEVMVILVINGKGIPNANKLVEYLDDYIYSLPEREDGVKYELKSVIVNINKGKTKELMGEECIAIAGAQVIHEEVGGLKFEISPLSFYQVNPVQMEKLYGKAMEYADFKGGETVLDLYCGVGTIGLFAVAAGAGKVIGIETVKGAVIDANRNAVINKIVNARYVCGKAEEVLPELVSGEEEDEGLRVESADVVFLDPPRAGCDERLLETVVNVAPEKIIYISCDPATLARDIKFLTEHGYEFIEDTPVDMFPHTMHIENVSYLRKNR